MLTACAFVGAFVGAFGGRNLRLPAPGFLDPLFLSAATHPAGITDSLPPPLLVNAAQVALGTILGCRFPGTAPRTVLRAGLLSLKRIAFDQVYLIKSNTQHDQRLACPGSRSI